MAYPTITAEMVRQVRFDVMFKEPPYSDDAEMEADFASRLNELQQRANKEASCQE